MNDCPAEDTALCVTGGAWPSSVRAVRCPVKSGNERDPCRQLPARPQGRRGHWRDCSRKSERKEGPTVGQYAPICPGLHAGYNGEYRGYQHRKVTAISKTRLSWDCGLQLARMNLEFLVSACQQRALNTSLGLAHTARRSTRDGPARGYGVIPYSMVGSLSRLKS